KQSLKSFISNMYVKITRSISLDTIKEIRDNVEKNQLKIDKNQFGYYLAGLLEGDGHLSLPFKGKTTLNSPIAHTLTTCARRILNPRIVFTSHINNIELFVYIQTMLKQKGRFQKVNENCIRYIIGDIEGIKLFIDIVHGKLRTSKNESFNMLINFINLKYNLKIPYSELDKSDYSTNSWLTGFTEADGHFGVKIVESKPKSDTRKRSVSNSISLKFRLDQRYEESNLKLMENLSKFLSCKLAVYNSNNYKVYSLYVSSIEKLEFIVEYFNKYLLLGIKGKDFKDWEIIYNMILCKQHLTEQGRLKIKLIQSNLNSKRKVKLNYKI
uniref:hypothetical protein n=1 Tax=Aspergillus sclerotioniger TaxID=319627 RepID=UPI00211419BC